MDILQEIIAWKRIEVEQKKQLLPPTELYRRVERVIDQGEAPSMQQALLNSKTGIIAEFKRRSPSKGWIKQEGRAEVIPLDYQRNGAAALSILTDEKYFGGKEEFITAARASGVTIPVLYKNFVVDEYQLFLAKDCGASAVLLIAAALSMDECSTLLRLAHDMKMEVLLEMHGENELDYAVLEPDMYGVNNRNLGSFVTDVNNSFLLADKLPSQGCKVSESGISNPHTVCQLRRAGFNGFLMGEHFMKAKRPGKALNDFILNLDNKQMSSYVDANKQ